MSKAVTHNLKLAGIAFLWFVVFLFAIDRVLFCVAVPIPLGAKASYG
jgi:hypothetical protein